MKLIVRGLVLSMALSTQAAAVTVDFETVTFDFEEFAPTRTNGQPTQGAYPTEVSEGVFAPFTSVRGIPVSRFTGSDQIVMTLSVVRVPFVSEALGTHTGVVFDPETLRFDLRQWSAMPSGFGTSALDPTFQDPMNGDDDDVWVLASFSEPLQSIVLQVTDAGVYQDTIRILAYAGENARGILADQVSKTFMGANPSFETVSLTLDAESEAGFFQSVLFRSEDPIVLRGDFTDNITVTLAEVPEPATATLLAFTIGALAISAGLLRRS